MRPASLARNTLWTLGLAACGTPAPAPVAEPIAEPSPVPAGGDAELTAFVEPNTKVHSFYRSDLNADGQEDALLILEGASEEGLRSLLILVRGADHQLRLAKRNNDVVFCKGCGGVFGDPFYLLEVKGTSFSVFHEGGSSDRWANRYTFGYSKRDDTWQLVEAYEGSHNSFEPEKGEEKTYTPPKDFGKIDISEFDPQAYLGVGPK